MRKFLKGEFGQTREVASSLVGSPDLYCGRSATASINFITCHDGFTLADLVSYSDKHNEANGEGNRDGADDNNSWNCGVEGPTDDPIINAAPTAYQKRNHDAARQPGVPMFFMGDECGRTQLGNNNAYCHDSPLNWFDWNLPAQNAELFRFCRLMIQFRHQHPVLKESRHFGPGAAEIVWHGTRAWNPDWSDGNRVLACQRYGRTGNQNHVIYIAANMHTEDLEFELPALPPGLKWAVAVNTSVPSPEDIWEHGTAPPLDNPTELVIGDRSIVVLIAQ